MLERVLYVSVEIVVSTVGKLLPVVLCAEFYNPVCYNTIAHDEKMVSTKHLQKD